MIVLDTHVWIWSLVARDRLSTTARAAIDEAGEIMVSSISCLEVANLVRRNRVSLDRTTESWISHALAAPRVRAVAIDPQIAAHAGALADPFPGDPADRLIYATSVVNGVRLVTRDQAIRRFDPHRTVW